MAFLVAPFFRRVRATIRSRKGQLEMVQPEVAGEAVMLDRERFQRTWDVFAIRVPPALCHATRKALKPHLLSINRVQSVVKQKDGEKKDTLLLLSRYLSQQVSDDSFRAHGNLDDSLGEASASQLVNTVSANAENSPPTIRNFLKSLDDASIATCPVTITYAHYSFDNVLRKLLPSDVATPTSFETIGHIAHLNLRDEHTPFKKLIGEVMLDKLAPRIRTVVNKLQSTGGPYRTFEMEVLAGPTDLVTKVRENGCTFSLDFQKVYWNSRLETEHRRIVDSLTTDDILVDPFCGVGPFAIPAAKRCHNTQASNGIDNDRAKHAKGEGKNGVTIGDDKEDIVNGKHKMTTPHVYANDLNPSSVKYLRDNMLLNNIQTGSIETDCSCAREFIRKLIKKRVRMTKVVMNHPAAAPEFLDVFRDVYKDWQGELPNMPVVHCYSFVQGINEMASARSRIRVALFGEDNSEDATTVLPDEKIEVREVRDVAPRKLKVCSTLTIPIELAWRSQERRKRAGFSVIALQETRAEKKAKLDITQTAADK